MFNNTAPLPPYESEYDKMMPAKIAGMMNNAQLGQGSGLLGAGGSGAYNPFTITKQPESKYKTTSILIEETSNGHIIRIGTVVRICPSDATLFDEVAAAYTEAKL